MPCISCGGATPEASRWCRACVLYFDWQTRYADPVTGRRTAQRKVCDRWVTLPKAPESFRFGKGGA